LAENLHYDIQKNNKFISNSSANLRRCINNAKWV